MKISDFFQPDPYDPYQEPSWMTKQLGLELLPDHDVATPTLVYAVDLRAFQQFVRACTVKNGVNNKRVKALTNSSTRQHLSGIPASFAHIAFVGIDPRDTPSRTGEFDSAWAEVERLRVRCHFKKAFVYMEWDDHSIIPNIMEGEREW